MHVVSTVYCAGAGHIDLVVVPTAFGHLFTDQTEMVTESMFMPEWVGPSSM